MVAAKPPLAKKHTRRARIYFTNLNLWHFVKSQPVDLASNWANGLKPYRSGRVSRFYSLAKTNLLLS